MKNIIYKILVCLPIVSLLGCNEKLDTVEGKTPTGVYMSKESVSIDIKADQGELILEPRLARLVDTDVQVTISVADFLEEYNKRNNTSYRYLPQVAYTLSEVNNPKNTMVNDKITITIKRGNYTSKLKLKIEGFDDQNYPINIRYAIPLKIVSADARVLQEKETIVTFNRPFSTSLVKVEKGNNLVAKLPADIQESSEFTAQMHVIFTDLDVENQTTINLTHNEKNGYYTRVASKTRGEATYGGSEGLQVKDGPADGPTTWTQKKLETHKWYQITYTFKNNEFKVYLNGELVNTLERFGKKILPGESIYVGNQQEAWSATHYLREVRFWNRALSAAEIKDGLYLPVDPESKGLLIYLPLDKKNGFNNLTKFNVEVKAPTNVEWIENVKFPAEKLEIQKP
ncbi:DUF1735 and LamG domain-containing protein [Capnocytophaga canimorsus]|uniref:DUF1735 and LamG domain-containing protein n=1 Tax=Capnocytophaga canimorsus TaxID=28188 RepID=UPI001AD16548|nr:DUF1735 and LamG domain-containing protein [Capnocytophaga canimorsus]GIM58457.1 hypothetical protein CAPN007_06640 [Capnocytophaga canimorsus]